VCTIQVTGVANFSILIPSHDYEANNRGLMMTLKNSNPIIIVMSEHDYGRHAKCLFLHGIS